MVWPRFLFILLHVLLYAKAEFSDYFSAVSEFLGLGQKNDGYTGGVIEQQIPYEVSVADEKFIHEAAKLTGVALSELDSCQHRVSPH